MNMKTEPEGGILDRSSGIALSDLDPESLLDECKCVFADILREEEIMEKKRRWLMGLPIEDRRGQKMLKTSNVFRNSYLRESYVRNDDVSLENIQASLNSASKSNKESMTSQWFDHDPENLSLEDSPDSPAKLPDGNHSNRMSMLSEILIKTANSDAIVSSSIHELINLLEVLPSQALMAMDRKLKNVTAVPQFAAPLSCRRSLLIKRLKKHCEKILLKTKPGGQLTAPLAKALSILCLAVKVKTRRTDFLTRKLTFFPFNEEINALQNEIVAAIWAIPRLRPKVWKQLHHLFTPNIEFSRRFFCKSLNNYLMECLFNCDDLELPGQLTMAVEIINKKIRCHVSSVKSAEEELESVLHLSSQLRQIISESLPDCDADKEYERYIEGLGIKDTSTIKTIDMDCSLFSIHDSAKISLAFSDQVEGSGDSMLDEPHLIIDAKGEDHGCLNLDVKNWYQELINICDDASLIAHKIIGRLLDELKRQEGCNLEVISPAMFIGIIGSLKPSLPKMIGEKFEKSLQNLS